MLVTQDNSNQVQAPLETLEPPAPQDSNSQPQGQEDNPPQPENPDKKQQESLFERIKKTEEFHTKKRGEWKKEKDELLIDRDRLKNYEELEQLLKTDPVSFLEKTGVTYDQLTKMMLERDKNTDPMVKTLKDRLDKIEKEKMQLEERQKQDKYEKSYQTLKGDVNTQIKENDYHLISALNFEDNVISYMQLMYEKHGILLDVKQACEDVNNDIAGRIKPHKNSKWLAEEMKQQQKEDKPKSITNKMVQASDKEKLDLTDEDDRIKAAIALAKKMNSA